MTKTSYTIQLGVLASMPRDPNNARQHSEEQLKQIEESILEFGFTAPVLFDDVVRAGNGRHEALERIYSSGKTVTLPDGTPLPNGMIPFIDCKNWNDDQRTAYAIADNKIAANASWDEDKLRKQLKSLSELSFNVNLTGFNEQSLKEELALLESGGKGDREEIPQLQDEATSKLGDMWQLGDHKIICGDSTDAETVSKLLGDKKPNLMVTDPPYGVEYDASWRESSGINKKGAAVGKVLNDDIADWSKAWSLFEGDVAYVWHAGVFAGVVADSLMSSGFKMRSQIIWAKSQMVMSRGDYHWQHEPCWYAVREKKKGNYVGGRKQTTLWNIDKPNKSETGHSTQKPVECMLRPIENNSKAGDYIYEPFSGSGTTIIACQESGRKCLAIELNPKYVDLAVERWENFTGKKAVLLNQEQD